MQLTNCNGSKRFSRLAAAGIFFQGGASAVDSTTVIAALLHGLTGSTYAVGAASAILRYGWLFPQLFVGYFAQQKRRRMPFYTVGAFGRATCLALLACVLVLGSDVGDDQRGLTISGVGPGISKRHCTLRAEEDGVVAEDHSSYGSFLNGSRIHGCIAIVVGDRLRLGTPGVELDLIAVAGDGA